MSKRYYTGIGSRSTPVAVLSFIRQLAHVLSNRGYTLRSGGAAGADAAFADGWENSRHSDSAEIYLPWNGFNNQYSTQEGRCVLDYSDAEEMAKDIHPAWHRLSRGAKTLHARNMHQVLGRDLNTPSNFVIFWTPDTDDAVSGGTASAVNLAKAWGIPVYNLNNPAVSSKLAKFINRNI